MALFPVIELKGELNGSEFFLYQYQPTKAITATTKIMIIVFVFIIDYTLGAGIPPKVNKSESCVTLVAELVPNFVFTLLNTSE